MVCDPSLIILSQTLSLHPDLSIALPIQALLLIPQLLQPQSWAGISTKASSWRQTERQVSRIWKVSRILKRVISSIQSEFVALKVWLTITYNVSFENQGCFFSVQKCPFEQKTWVPLGKVLCFSGTWPPHAEWGSEWPVRSSLMNSSFPWLPTLEVQRKVQVPGF